MEIPTGESELQSQGEGGDNKITSKEDHLPLWHMIFHGQLVCVFNSYTYMYTRQMLLCSMYVYIFVLCKALTHTESLV